MTTEVEVKDTPEVLLEKLRAANAEAATYRKERDGLQSRVTELEADDSTTVWKNKALLAYVRGALKEQGVKDVDRVLKVLDLNGVDLDENDKLAGFDEKVTATKTEWPELFDAKKRVANNADIFADGEVKKQASGTEMQVARIMKRN